MMFSRVLLHAGIIGLITSASIKKRWTNGSTATVGPGTPSLSSTDCTLTVGNSYCVEGLYVPPPSSTTSTTSTTITTTTTTTTTRTTTTTKTSEWLSPTQTGLEPSCNKSYLVVTRDTCFDIAVAHGVELQQFYEWNPAVGSACSNLQAGYYVYVGVPGQTTTRTTSITTTTTTAPEPTALRLDRKGKKQKAYSDATGNKFYMVASGDTCAAIAADNGIALNNFYAWNAAVRLDCSALWGGYYVCVGIPVYEEQLLQPRTTTTTTTSTGTGPFPTQSGIIKTCTQYYQAKSGDTCSSILAGRYSYVPMARFITWNPAFGSSCTGLGLDTITAWLQKPGPPQPGTVINCKKYHRVVSGNTCQTIQQMYGITAAQFNRWNPRYFVCVGF
ncbi:hypothetical protein BDV12DRAFT_187662 [Aspergillus spectabilis]